MFARWRSLLRDWLLITVSTPGGGKGTERVYAWRALRRLGSCYLHQAVCVLPSNAGTRSAIDKLIDHLHSRGASGEVFVIQFTDHRQEARLIERFQAERSDEYGEVVERTQEFHEELELERGRGGSPTPSLRNPMPTSHVIRNGWPPSRPVITSPRPGARRPRPRYRRVSGHLPSLSKRRWRRSSPRVPASRSAAVAHGRRRLGLTTALMEAARNPKRPAPTVTGAPSGVQQSRLSARCG